MCLCVFALNTHILRRRKKKEDALKQQEERLNTMLKQQEELTTMAKAAFQQATGSMTMPSSAATKPIITTKYKTLDQFLAAPAVEASQFKAKFVEADIRIAQLPTTTLERLISIGLKPGTADRVFAEAHKFA